MITYAYSPYLCTAVKLYLLLGLLIIGAIGYATVEYLEYKQSNDSVNIANEDGKGKFSNVRGKSAEIAD